MKRKTTATRKASVKTDKPNANVETVRPAPTELGTFETMPKRQFPMDYAPLQASLPVNNGSLNAKIRNENGHDTLTLHGIGLQGGEASISIPLDHATELLNRLTILVNSAKAAGLQVA